MQQYFPTWFMYRKSNLCLDINNVHKALLFEEWNSFVNRNVSDHAGSNPGLPFQSPTPKSLGHKHGDAIKWKHFPRYWPFVRGNLPVIGEFPAQRPVTRSCDIFFGLRLNKRLNKNCEAGDLRRHRAHYDVTVMVTWTAQSLRHGSLHGK